MRKTSIVKRAGGLVLTKTSTVSPARTDCRDAKPSIQRDRDPFSPSTRTRVNCQSSDPSRRFSRRTRSGEASAGSTGGAGGPPAPADEAAAPATAAEAPARIKSRRVIVGRATP
jgi:hypothetical protein